ncbi:cellulase family glycosylhydrolase [Pelomyxa schiedti]|nr:cellulase family glycosylhydrolase [Pelomyxa schiedti]
MGGGIWWIICVVTAVVQCYVVLEDFDNYDSWKGDWAFSNGPEFPGAEGDLGPGKGYGEQVPTGGALLSFDFTAGGSYVGMLASYDSSTTLCDMVSFWVSTPPCGAAAVFRVTDETSQTFQVMLPPEADESGWARYVVDVHTLTNYWGGNNDGIFHGGISAIELILDHNNLPTNMRQGSVVFDQLECYAYGESVYPTITFIPFDVYVDTWRFNKKIHSLLGVNIHFVEPDVDALYAARLIGFGFVRMDLTWSEVEKTKGEYDFSGYDKLVQALQTFSMKALFILDYGNPLYYDGPQPYDGTYGPSSLEYQTAYANFARAAAQHFNINQLVGLELWNEPNIENFWHPVSPANYASMAHLALEQIKLANPQMPVMLGGLSTVDTGFLDSVLSSQNFSVTSFTSVHPYRTNNPETYYTEMQCARDDVTSHLGIRVPVINGEWGYSSAWYGSGSDTINLEKQALYCIRELLYSFYTNTTLTVWYDLMNDGTSDTDPEHNFGLLYPSDYEPKPNYKAVEAFYSIMVPDAVDHTFSFYSTDTTISHVKCLIIDDIEKEVAVLWETRDDVIQPIDLDLTRASIPLFYDMYGNKLTGVSCDETALLCHLDLDGSAGPVYVIREY